MKEKTKNIWRIIWIIGIYAILVLILYLVVIYKIKWENKDLNTYMYFYNCSNELCTTSENVDTYYSRIKCDKDICPYIKDKKDNLVILINQNKEYLYDYLNETIINDNYSKYRFINNNYYIVTDENNLESIINSSNEVITNKKYEKILDFKNDKLVYLEDNKYGIDNLNGNNIVKTEYNDIILINDTYYAYQLDNTYKIAAYNNNETVNDIEYDYLYAEKDIILTIKDKQIDILNSSLESKLLMKIDTYYEYKNDQEINTLNIHSNDKLLYFNVFNGYEDKEYIYDIKNHRII